jgi:hypothetical protein
MDSPMDMKEHRVVMMTRTRITVDVEAVIVSIRALVE